MEGAKDEGGERYQLQTLVHRYYDNQEWSRHCARNDGVVDIKHQGDKIILVKLLVEDLIFNFISDYAPQIGLNESIKRQFWEELDALVSSVPISKKHFIGGDLNVHIGSTRVGFDGVHEGFRYGSRN
jgi:hypothetical protein